MANLSQQERDRIRDSLESKIKQLSAIEARLEHEALKGLQPDVLGEVSHVPHHSADIGDLASTQRVDLTLAEAELNEIAQIQRALGKLNSPEYGMCERCEKEIAPERLKAVPAAPYCMHCETQFEAKIKARKRPGDSTPYNRPLEDEQEIPY